MLSSTLRKHLATALGLAVINVVFLQMTLWLHLPPTIWPSTGFVLAGFLTLGALFIWPVVLGGLFSLLAIAILDPKGFDLAKLSCLFLFAPALQILVSRFINRKLRVNDQLSGLNANLDFVQLAILSTFLTASCKAILGIGSFGASTAWTWIAWWFAESAGAIIFTPYLMILWGPRDLWNSRKRDLILAGVFIVGISVALISYTKHQSTKEENYQIRIATEYAMNQINTVINLANSSLAMVESSSGLNSKLTYEIFSKIAEKSMQINPLLRAMTWVPKIQEHEVKSFESRMSHELKRPFHIFEKDLSGQIIRLKSRREYFPVAYIYPQASNEKAIGFDLASEDKRRAAIAKVLESRKPASTKPVKLVQDPNSRFGGVLYFVPLWSDPAGMPMTGMYNVVIDLNKLFSPLMDLSRTERLDFYILDVGSEKILGSNIDQPMRTDFTKKSPWELIQEHPLSIADQNWRIIFTKDLSLVAPKFANWLIICLSMLLGCAMVVGVLVITGNIEELKTLLRALSHDLNNPLTVIMGYARKGKLDMENAGQVAPALYFSKILNSAENQRDVIEHFKMMRANADGKNTLKLEKVSIASVISQIEHTFEQRLRDKQLTLKVPSSENAKIPIIAEPISLNHNVFNNLISNAIKFSHIGGAIEITVQESTNLVQVVVRDHGVGMPKDLANKVFRSDLSTSRVGTGGETGTGFGMPVAKAYMTRYGGSIHITSRTETESPGDHGTTVLLTFKSGSIKNG